MHVTIPKWFRMLWRSVQSECMLPSPGPLVPAIIKDERDSMLVYNQPFPAFPTDSEHADDIAGIQFSVMQGGVLVPSLDGYPNPQLLPKDATQTDFIVDDKAGDATTSFSYYDDADPPNFSLHPKERTFTPRDTIPPADPGDMPEPKLVNEIP